MAKTLFIAVADEDRHQRNLLRRHLAHTPVRLVDAGPKELYDIAWKERVRNSIRHAHGVIVLVSENSLTCDAQQWEIRAARAARKKMRGVWAYGKDRTALPSLPIVPWTQANVLDFVGDL